MLLNEARYFTDITLGDRKSINSSLLSNERLCFILYVCCFQKFANTRLSFSQFLTGEDSKQRGDIFFADCRETKNLFKGIARRYRWSIFHGWGFSNCCTVVRESWIERKIGTTMVKARYWRKDSSRKDTIAMISSQRSRNDPRTWPYSRKQGCTISFCQHAARTGFKIESFVVKNTFFRVLFPSRFMKMAPRAKSWKSGRK